MTWAILNGQDSKLSWVGVGAGMVLGLGLLAVRLSMASSGGEALFAIGLTVVEIAAVLLLEYLARSLRARQVIWEVDAKQEHLAQSNLAASQWLYSPPR